MKALCAVVVLLLVFTGCNKPTVKPEADAQQPSPMVIDYPAGVMISKQNQSSTKYLQNFAIAENILLPHSIPVVKGIAGKLEFVKQNGDRITLSTDDLAGKYDIILFNTFDNPLPLRIADLGDALGRVFRLPVRDKVLPKKLKRKAATLPSVTDTSGSRHYTPPLHQLKPREKKIVVAVADSSDLKLMSRAIPGIEWIEHRVDTRKILTIDFANDIITYANTDRYFTNGITFSYQAPWMARWQIRKLMVPYNHKANITYSLSLVLDMYTPTDTRVAPTLADDRPYASYLYMGFRKTTADPLRKLKLTSELDIGYLGPYSPGSYLQSMVHKTFPTNDEPQGWDTQISTDIILNYGVQAEKAVIFKENISLLAGLKANVGTLYTNAGAGFKMQAGKAEPVFGLAENEKWPKLQYYFFVETNVSFVAYNALLQGGAFNHDNVFTLHADEIQHVVGDAQAGIHFRYKNSGIEIAQHYLTPEYKRGLWHKWGRISVLIGF